MDDGITFVILGATGDLTKRKLLPAIYHLVERRELKNFAIVAAARRRMKFSSIIREAKKFVPKGKKKVWREILKRGIYTVIDFYNEGGYRTLQEELMELEKKFNLPGKRIFYLATLPDHFEVITQGVSKYGCLSKKKGWPRVAFEKPFGRDLESARKLNKRILKAFPEKQVYRVDHYLGKELIENISLMRFTNRIIEPLWCAKHIESVQIIANEKIGVEGRGGFYNKYGALKDFFQNHLLQIVALLGMEQPRRIAGKALRDEKVKVLRKVRVEDVLLGQYQGYGKERGVSRGSKTETFAVLKLRIGTGRWKGVPFFVKTGKMLNDGSSLIDIKFKKVKCLLDTCPRDTNHLRIILKPQNSIAFVVNSKKIGGTVVEPVEMNFSHSNEYGVNTPKAYETLLTEIIEGKQTAFVRNDEIEAAWKVVDSITRKKVFSYKKWSSGPKELKSWSMKNHVDWKA